MAAPPPIKKYKVSDLKSKILRPALTSHYICKFQPPTHIVAFQNFINYRTKAGFEGLNYSTEENQSLIELSCTEASLPGSTLATYDINDSFPGVTEKIAYRRLYDDRADFTFYVDGDYKIIQFFENWISFIAMENDIEYQRTKQFTHRVEYRDSYSTDNLYIVKFERDYSGKSLMYQFIGAYPISINSMPVTYDSSQLLRCTVSFTYMRYVVSPDTIEIPKDEPPPANNPVVNNATPKTSDNVFDYQSNILSDEYYLNFGDNTQNSTNTGDFFDGSNPGPFGTAIG